MDELKRFKYLEHTADAKFRAYGKTLEESFTNAALAVFNIMVDTKKVEPKTKKEINIAGKTLESLLFDFLDELLFFLDTEDFLLHNIQAIKIKQDNGKFALKAELTGDKIREKYKVSGIVKAITYNEMEIKKKNNQWTITAVVDR